MMHDLFLSGTIPKLNSNYSSLIPKTDILHGDMLMMKCRKELRRV